MYQTHPVHCRGADRRVQGGLLPVRQGRRWHDHDEGARHGDALARPEPDRGGAPGHDQRGRCRRQRHHRLPRVLHAHGAQDEGHRLRGGAQGGRPHGLRKQP